ncbi:MAG: hypothetical protein M5R36_28600 [Deltaproteobacteria bacterium]|nr:hypothetical protein [Deltaproteobacteria bacterium]
MSAWRDRIASEKIPFNAMYFIANVDTVDREVKFSFVVDIKNGDGLVDGSEKKMRPDDPQTWNPRSWDDWSRPLQSNAGRIQFRGSVELKARELYVLKLMPR